MDIADDIRLGNLEIGNTKILNSSLAHQQKCDAPNRDETSH